MKHVSGKQMCRILERHGWTLARIRGSHRRYEREGYSPVVVPVHGNKTLKAGTQKSIMNTAGLTDDDLGFPTSQGSDFQGRSWHDIDVGRPIAKTRA